MNVPPGIMDFQPIGYGFDGAGGGRGGFRPNAPVNFPPSENLDAGGYSGGRGFQSSTEPDYSVRLTSPPVQQPLSGQKRGRTLSEQSSFTGTGKLGAHSTVVLC